MALDIVRRIRGNMEENIPVTALENAVLTHPYLQRMRRIRQLAFLHYVFPGATHTRFEHALGVMHLAGIAWEKLRANQRRLSSSCLKFDDFSAREKAPAQGDFLHGLLAPTFAILDDILNADHVVQVMRLAGLLHDLGHPPFSHSGERFLPSWQATYEANAPALPPYLHTYFERSIARLKDQGKDPAKERVTHETLSILMIDRVLEETCAAYPHLAQGVSPQDVAAVLSTDIAPPAGSDLHKYGMVQLCRELIAGELDIDRMDYLLRDSRECGVVYGIFDTGRIFDALCLYYNPADGGFHIAITMAGLAAFEDYLRARHSMYMQVYYHKTSVAAEAMCEYLCDMLGDFTLPARLEEYAAFDEFSIGFKLNQWIEEHPSRARYVEAGQLLRDLLYDRRLFKRVYEISSSHPKDGSLEQLAKIRNYLHERGMICVQMSSSKALTRFSPRLAREPSRNYLRLVKKDARQFPRVYPIEDFAQVIGTSATVTIHRLYCRIKDDATGPDQASKLKSDIAEILL